jgi:branched-chain amino acid transport system permease protein
MGGLPQMFLVLAMTIWGGIGTLFGPVAGAILLEVLSEALRDFGQAHILIYALLILVVYRFRPQGLFGGRS